MATGLFSHILLYYFTLHGFGNGVGYKITIRRIITFPYLENPAVPTDSFKSKQNNSSVKTLRLLPMIAEILSE